MIEQYVILQGGDFDKPYRDLSGGLLVFEGKQAAKRARRPGDVAVPLSDWEGWDE